MCTVTRDFFKFWKLSNNISEIVQDRDKIAPNDTIAIETP